MKKNMMKDAWSQKKKEEERLEKKLSRKNLNKNSAHTIKENHPSGKQ